MKRGMSRTEEGTRCVEMVWKRSGGSRAFHFLLLLVCGVRKELAVVNEGISASQVAIRDADLVQRLSPSEKQR